MISRGGLSHWLTALGICLCASADGARAEAPSPPSTINVWFGALENRGGMATSGSDTRIASEYQLRCDDVTTWSKDPIRMVAKSSFKCSYTTDGLYGCNKNGIASPYWNTGTFEGTYRWEAATDTHVVTLEESTHLHRLTLVVRLNRDRSGPLVHSVQGQFLNKQTSELRSVQGIRGAVSVTSPCPIAITSGFGSSHGAEVEAVENFLAPQKTKTPPKKKAKGRKK